MPARPSAEDLTADRAEGRADEVGDGGKTDPVDDGATAPAGRRTRRRRRPPGWLGVALLALLVLALAVALVVLLLRPTETEARESAVEAAVRYTTSLTTFDARTLDEDLERVQAVSTESFGRTYEETIESNREQITDTQQVSQGSVRAAGVSALEDDRATVLLAVDVSIRRTGQTEVNEAARIEVDLVRRDGSWYLDAVRRL